MSQKRNDEHPSVTLFREYLRIRSVQPNPDYESIVNFFTRISQELDLPIKVLEPSEGKPIIFMIWTGSNPKLPALLLNSHTDVVPVDVSCWKNDPFDAIKDEEGNIYGRGTQDMKSVTIQHVEAIRRLKASGKKYERSIILSFVPDEEIGGSDGMVRFLKTKEFLSLNIGCALDEGIASGSNDSVIPLFYGERNNWLVTFKCSGSAGHGSQFISDTAAGKAQILINTLLSYREEQKRKYEENSSVTTLGDVTTINLTYMSGGSLKQMNVVPHEFTVGFDIRITPKMKLCDFEELINTWVSEAAASGTASDIETTYVTKFTAQPLSSIAQDDPWYGAFKSATDKLGLCVKPRIFPAATDSRFLREIGIPAFGFSPMPHTPLLLHAHNEYLNEKIFLDGIEVFMSIIDSMASSN